MSTKDLKTTIQNLITSLEHFAEDPTDASFEKAPCHSGICKREKCGRCSRGINAFNSIKDAEDFLNQEFGEMLSVEQKQNLKQIKDDIENGVTNSEFSLAAYSESKNKPKPAPSRR